MRKKTWLILLAVVAIAGVGFFGFTRLRANAGKGKAKVQTAEVTRGTLVATINTAGTIQAHSSVNLVFQASGMVKEIKVKEGDQVKANDEIAALDSNDTELAVQNAQTSLDVAKIRLDQTKAAANPRDLATAEASLASAQASYDAAKAKVGLNDAQLTVARANLDKAEIALQNAQAAYDRISWKPGVAATNASTSLQQATIDYNSAKANYDLQVASINDTAVKSAYAQLVSAQANYGKLQEGASSQDVAISQASVSQAEIALQQAKNKRDATVLTAPFDGTVTRLTLQIGQMVGASSAAGAIADLNNLEIAADMSEVDVAKIKVGQEVDITLDALSGKSYKGHVLSVALAGTSTQGVVNFPVVIRLDKADPAIKPGMTASASIIIERRDNVLLVPGRAVRTQGQQKIVRVLFQGQEIDTNVQVGLTGDSGVEIMGDTLKEGDVVVIPSSTTSVSTNGALRTGGGMGGIGAAFGR
jgi:HlyD family secretion protein